MLDSSFFQFKRYSKNHISLTLFIISFIPIFFISSAAIYSPTTNIATITITTGIGVSTIPYFTFGTINVYIPYYSLICHFLRKKIMSMMIAITPITNSPAQIGLHIVAGIRYIPHSTHMIPHIINAIPPNVFK